MVIANTPANRTLIRKLRNAVDAYESLIAHADSRWNLGKDIRFEIGCHVRPDFNPNALVVTEWENGSVSVRTRLLPRDPMNPYETLQLGHLLLDIDEVTERIEHIVSEWAH